MSNTKQPIIEKGIEMPEKKGNAKDSGSTTYPFEALEVDDSFLAGAYSLESMRRISVSCVYYGNKLERKFSCRKTDEGYIRVWRTI